MTAWSERTGNVPKEQWLVQPLILRGPLADSSDSVPECRDMNIAALLEKAQTSRGLPPPAMRRALRQSAGLSQADVADVLDVTRATIARYELGQRTPKGELLEDYMAVLAALASQEKS
jgi:DNA-binding XRE family transcriptional regulator